MLLREEPDASWSEASLAERFRLPLALVAEAAAGLRRADLLEVTGTSLRLRPRTPDLAAAAEELARLYAGNRAAVLSWMSRNALARIRRAAADAFADSFRLKRREDAGGRDA